MYENSETPIKTNNYSIAEYILLVIITTIGAGILRDVFPTIPSRTISYILIISILLISVSFLFLSSKKIYLKSDGILVKKRFNQYKIFWNDILGMSTISNKATGYYYEIRTNKKIVSIPVPKEWKNFENTIVENADLELIAKSVFGETSSKPGIKR